MADTKQLTLPITGMTCANCVATVERNLKKLDGVNTAVVNLSSERATVEFDSAKLGLDDDSLRQRFLPPPQQMELNFDAPAPTTEDQASVLSGEI